MQALERYGILDTEPERAFDQLAVIASRALGMPMALVSLVDERREWLKAKVGLGQSEVGRASSFGAHALVASEPLVVHDAQNDARFCKHPWVTGEPHARFYAAATLRTPSGLPLGTLSVLDRSPRELDAEQLAMLQELATIAVGQLELRSAQRERRLAERVVHTSPDVIYVFDLRSRSSVYTSPAFARLAGYDGREAGGALLERIIHPDDLPRVIAHYENFARLDDEARIEIMFRMRGSTGAFRWFIAHEAVFERDAAGAAVQVIGVATDITALKDTEAAFSRSQESLRMQLRVLNGVLESAGDGIVVTDERGEPLVFNPAAERILGVGALRCRPEDWSATYGLLTPDARSPLPVDQLPLVRALRGQASDDVEMLVRNVHVPAGVFISATGRPLLDAQGAVRGGVVTLSDVTKLKVAQRELTRLASLDGLTGIPNHRAFKERLAQLAAEGERGRRFTLVLCDVDHFKQLNDRFGHPMGDRVLVAFAHALRENARATDMVARYGGEEFAVLYTDVDESLACTLVDRLVRALARLDAPMPVTASFGVCEYSSSFGGDVSALLAAADRALYRAKDEGRNRVVRFATLPPAAPQ